MMWPPHRVNTHSTPASLSARAASLPPWTGDMALPRCRVRAPTVSPRPRQGQMGRRWRAIPRRSRPRTLRQAAGSAGSGRAVARTRQRPIANSPRRL
jgi:hypothetical protein